MKVPNDKVFVNDEFEITGKEATVTCFKVLFLSFIWRDWEVSLTISVTIS
jgi:hypothetical protein